MLRVLSGFPEKLVNSWLRGSVIGYFDRVVREEWLEDDIIHDELRAVDKIVKVDGLMLTKETGRRIPVNWLSHGSKQFICMTQYTDIIYDSFHYGANVYEFFYRWIKEKNVDVTLLINSNGSCLIKNEFKGIFLNTGVEFNSGKELANLYYDYGNCYLEETEDRREIVVHPVKEILFDKNDAVPDGDDSIIRW